MAGAQCLSSVGQPERYCQVRTGTPDREYEFDAAEREEARVKDRTPTPGASELIGRLGGAVLGAIRGRVGLTQEGFAEQLGVGVSTLQAWESGRRPLVNASFAEIQRVNRGLRALADPSLLVMFEKALMADSIYGELATAGSPEHPLSVIVPDRTLTELLAWPLTGEAPRQLSEVRTRLYVPSTVQDAVARDLCDAADQAGTGTERTAMLRRQVKFLVASNDSAREWLRQQTTSDTRALPDLSNWSPSWALARSQAVASAHSGDLDPLRRFIDQGLASDELITANLNYWAYWVGEHDTYWTDDRDMVSQRATWSGDRLLSSLVSGVATAPYRELCAHALWALLKARRDLLRNSEQARDIGRAVEIALSDEAGLTGKVRQRMEQVAYLVESAV